MHTSFFRSRIFQKQWTTYIHPLVDFYYFVILQTSKLYIYHNLNVMRAEYNDNGE